jgi:hypothetical protein
MQHCESEYFPSLIRIFLALRSEDFAKELLDPLLAVVVKH